MQNTPPIYQKIKEEIRSKITSGTYPSGACLPSESDYCQEYGVSRMTLRKAIDELCYDGLLYRVRGKGTFVNKKVMQPVTYFSSFTKDIQSLGLVPSSKLLLVETIKASADLAERFQVTPNTSLIAIKRLRYANDQPMAIEYAYYLESLCHFLQDAFKNTDAKHLSAYALLEAHGIKLHKAFQSIEAITPTKKDATLLEVTTLSPCLLIMRQTFDTTGSIVEVVDSIYSGSKYRFTSELYAKI